MTMPVKDPPRSDYESSCLSDGNGPAIRDILNLVGDKWSLLAIGTLQHGALRFGELKRHIPGVSQRMLTLTLRQLERDGLITRSVLQQSVVRVEYELTPTGRTLIAPSLALAAWAIDNYANIIAARRTFDAALR